MAGQGDHDLRMDVDAIFGDLGRRFKDGSDLHLGHARTMDAQTHAPQPQHRVGLPHRFDGRQHLLLFRQLSPLLPLGPQSGHVGQQLFVAGQELVEGRVDQTDDDR